MAVDAAWEGTADNPIADADVAAQVRAFPRRLSMPAIPSGCGHGKPRTIVRSLPCDPGFVRILHGDRNRDPTLRIISNRPHIATISRIEWH